ncbi:hypothetical protein [Microbulbifer sp. S227A]|uniref:hypothetical protein n=1 Tax=Microbulbifer sp. S227A TaxID=3415131 RepID=UPI003C7C7BF6
MVVAEHNKVPTVFHRLKAMLLHRPKERIAPYQSLNIPDLAFDNATTPGLIRGENLMKPIFCSKMWRQD